MYFWITARWAHNRQFTVVVFKYNVLYNVFLFRVSYVIKEVWLFICFPRRYKMRKKKNVSKRAVVAHVDQNSFSFTVNLSLKTS